LFSRCLVLAQKKKKKKKKKKNWRLWRKETPLFAPFFPETPLHDELV
jgi:hypothetical protein